MEMGYDVKELAFYEVSTNRMIPINVPGVKEKYELKCVIERFKQYDPISTEIIVNSNKCIHCIYCNLCDKTDSDNVYT